MAAILTYFRGRGRAETTRWMLAATGVDFVNIPIDTPQELAELRASGKMPFDQMPLLEIDGLCLSQSSAMIRILARRGDLYGTNDDDAMWCDMVAGAVSDFAEVAMQAAFKPSPEIAITDLKKSFQKFAPRFEARIQEQGSGYCAANNLTFADIVLAEALCSYLEWVPGILEDAGRLKSLYLSVIGEPQISAYLSSALRYPKPDDEYVVSAARVLQRALPPHMPDPDRFVI